MRTIGSTVGLKSSRRSNTRVAITDWVEVLLTSRERLLDDEAEEGARPRRGVEVVAREDPLELPDHDVPVEGRSADPLLVLHHARNLPMVLAMPLAPKLFRQKSLAERVGAEYCTF